MRPQAFGRYEMLSRISMGGMAEVFRATHLPSSTQVALKRIRREIAEDDDFIEMFEDEARIASQLEHPYIARCLDFGHVDGEWYIAFEYVHGKDLRALFDRCTRAGEPPPLWFVLYVFTRIAEGLSYAHARRDAAGNPVSIVHRDVSPQNIIVSFDGDVKLIDFGIAKAAGKLSKTQVGTIKGKFGYMAPEQVRGVEVDSRADVFSMGICMWELLTLQRLFNADNELLVIEKVRHLQVEPPSRYAPRIPPGLDRIILKALAKDPNERYRATKDVYKDLNHVAGQLGVAPREQIAQYMRRTFPEAPADSDGRSDANVNARQVREMGPMATQNDKGSDLDIFEGLGKKAAPGPTPSRPPPPSSSRSQPPPPPGMRPPDPSKRTLLGMAAPATMPLPAPASVRPGSRPDAGRTPPPPPGRGSLPPVVAPPPKPAPPAPKGDTLATAPNAAVDMDWEDDDEATHIFDKPEEAAPIRAGAAPIVTAPTPAAGMMPVQALAKPKATLLGLTAPQPNPPPPPSSSIPGSRPPPPPPSAAFARASGVPAAAPGPAFPPPPTIQPVPPPPMTQQGLGPPPSMRVPSVPPPPVAVGGPPMPMPMPMPAPLPRPASVPDYGPAPRQRSMEATALVRPAQSRAGLWAIVGVAGVAVIGIVVFLLMPRTGRILINVADTKNGSVNRVDIFVDGRKTPCETAPCIVDQVAAGAHEVKVMAEGYDAVTPQSVQVEARKDVTATFTLASSSKGQGIEVGGSQPGVQLYVDDKEAGPLPQEVRDLAPGDHVVKIAGSERYQPLEKHVTVTKDAIEDLGTVTLKVLKGKATISLGTPGAKVYLVSGSDRRELPVLPISVDIDTGKAWSLQASKTGFADYTQPITFDDGQAEKSYTVTLEPRTAATPAVAAYTPPPAPAPYRAPAPAPAPAPARAAAAPESDGSGGGGDAYLNINSIPASTCFLDGRSLGPTPRAHVTVKPGTHTVKFVNSDQGLTKTVTVTVGAGQTKPAVARLE